MAVSALAVFCMAGVSFAGGRTGNRVDVRLKAAPNVKTQAKADAKFNLDRDGDELHYTLRVTGIKDVTMAHIHAVADDGSLGPILAWIYPKKGMSPSLKRGKYTGVLSEGYLTAGKFIGPEKGKSAKDVLEMLKSGKAGVAVHTQEHPAGELWGVLKHGTAATNRRTATGKM